MKKKFIIIPIFFVGMAILITWILMELWNWLMPDLFDLSRISFWQAFGLLILSKLLFGGMNGGKHKKAHCHYCGGENRKYQWKEKFKQKWSEMPHEEREKWQEKFSGLKCEPRTTERDTDDLIADNNPGSTEASPS